MSLKRLEVRYHHDGATIRVGVLAEQGASLFFEYDERFLRRGHWLSPFKLPLRAGLQQFEDWRFSSVWGLFADSLPDGWGLLLMDRFFQSQGRFREAISILERLAYLGSNTMGALTYHPATELETQQESVDLYQLAQESQQVLSGDTTEVLRQLLCMGGSPGGARPKVLVGLRDDNGNIVSGVKELREGYTPYILKFHARVDEREEGRLEESYAQVARLAGLDIPQTRLLLEPKSNRHYFAIRRFDRQNNHRIHVHTLGGLLHSSHRHFDCDYHNLLQITRVLTKKQTCVEKVFRQMLFNIILNNRDDHVKNFSFLYNGTEWFYAPSYDLTFNAGPRGEHSMTVAGEGLVPGLEHVQKLATAHSVGGARMRTMLEEVLEASTRWVNVATGLDVSSQTISRIESKIEDNRSRFR